MFVLYLTATGGYRTFKLKIYDGEMNILIASKELVMPSASYGAPTDIRVASDGQYLYAFYETFRTITPGNDSTYLWGAKYVLDDNFTRVAYTSTPITRSKPVTQLSIGGEKVDDPAPLMGPFSVFVITRLHDSLRTSGNNRYRVREFNKNDLMQLSQFDLNLSNIADGRGRVTSLTFWQSNIYVALATTVSDSAINENSDDGALSDIICIKMNENWTYNSSDVRSLSTESNDRENYVSGFKVDSNYFYITYKQAIGSPPSGQQRAWIKIYDRNFDLVDTIKVKSTIWGPSGEEVRPSLEVFGNRIFSGQSIAPINGSGYAKVFVFETVTTSADNMENVLPREFALYQNYPNPFNPTTTIRFSLPERTHVTLKVFDVLGREVATLVDQELNAGEHSVVFNAKDLVSGVYFYRLTTPTFSQTKSMVFVK